MTVEQTAMAMWWVDWLRTERNASPLTKNGIENGWAAIESSKRASYRQLAKKYLRALGKIK